MIRRTSSQLNNSRPDGSGTPLTHPGRYGNARFEATSGRAIKLAQRRKWTLVGTLVLALAAAAGLFAWHQVGENRERALTSEFLGIEAQFQSELEVFQSKREALPKEQQMLDHGKPDHAASTQRFQAFATKHANTPLGWQAALRAAGPLAEAGKPAEAATLLESVLPGTRKSTLVQARVRRSLAGFYADLGQFDKAISELVFIEKLPDAPALDETKLFHAQVLYLAGKKDEAKSLLVELSRGGDLGPLADRSVASEASLWLNYWGLQ